MVKLTVTLGCSAAHDMVAKTKDQISIITGSNQATPHFSSLCIVQVHCQDMVGILTVQKYRTVLRQNSSCSE